MPLTVADLRQFLEKCQPHDIVVVTATLADGSVIDVRDLNIGTDQAGTDGEGIEVVIDWEPGTEVVS